MKSETTFVEQDEKLVLKCGFRFHWRASKNDEIFDQEREIEVLGAKFEELKPHLRTNCQFAPQIRIQGSLATLGTSSYTSCHSTLSPEGILVQNRKRTGRRCGVRTIHNDGGSRSLKQRIHPRQPALFVGSVGRMGTPTLTLGGELRMTLRQ